MKLRTQLAVASLAIVTLLFWCTNLSCITNSTAPNVTRPPTLGAELTDLDRARRAGLLTDEEYELERANAIARFKTLDAQLKESPHDEPTR